MYDVHHVLQISVQPAPGGTCHPCGWGWGCVLMGGGIGLGMHARDDPAERYGLRYIYIRLDILVCVAVSLG